MTPDLIAHLKAEEADLSRKLDAVRATLAVYGERPTEDDKRVWTPSRPRQSPTETPREKLPLDRFSAYGVEVIKTSMAIINERPGGPVATRDLVEALADKGVEVRGNDKVNALSALLARSRDVMSHGRRGWTVAPAPGLRKALAAHGEVVAEYWLNQAGRMDEAMKADAVPDDDEEINPFA